VTCGGFSDVFIILARVMIVSQNLVRRYRVVKFVRSYDVVFSHSRYAVAVWLCTRTLSIPGAPRSKENLEKGKCSSRHMVTGMVRPRFKYDISHMSIYTDYISKGRGLCGKETSRSNGPRRTTTQDTECLSLYMAIPARKRDPWLPIMTARAVSRIFPFQSAGTWRRDSK
jgi:hypothetical protein